MQVNDGVIYVDFLVFNISIKLITNGSLNVEFHGVKRYNVYYLQHNETYHPKINQTMTITINRALFANRPFTYDII